MKSILTTAGLILVAALYLPELVGGAGSYNTEPVSNVRYEDQDGPRTARAFKDRLGHFKFNARMNGTYIKVLVDTGASMVAINLSTARRIGLQLDEGDFRHSVNTANGRARMARARIDEIKIDGIVVRNVEAAVLDDAALSSTLLGMSFLNKLKKFEIEDRTLRLTQ